MKLVLLGTAGYHPNDRRQTACFMIPELGIILDAGTAMYRVRERIATTELDIFLSHAHLDHVMGLTCLLNVLEDKPVKRVTIHGAEEKLRAVKEHVFAEPIFPIKPHYEFRPLSGEVELSGGGRLKYFPLAHPGGALGFRLDWPDRSLAYVTDTTASIEAGYVESIQGVDVLLHESYLPDSKREWAAKMGHSYASAVAEVARHAGAGRLILVHVDPLSTGFDPVGISAARNIFPATEVGTDLMEVEF